MGFLIVKVVSDELRITEMIEFEEAYEKVMNSAFSTGTETVFFSDSLNRILAGDITSDMAIFLVHKMEWLK